MFETIEDRILEEYQGEVAVSTPPCVTCGQWGTLVLTSEQVRGLESGQPIQDAAPALPLELREQYISGTHPACWNF